jgi:beta-ureidopropionase / N-carbamoyl-L-amino-acid hydrolase
MTMHINRDRFLADMQAQAEIGATGDGGLSRPALSEADMQIRAWFADRAGTAGLELQEDGAANQSAILRSHDPRAKTLIIGSHLDSVIHGGRFDGALGVVAALETVRTIQDANLSLPFHLACINFTDEESRHFPLLGSSALSGRLTESDLDTPRYSRDEFEAGMQRAGITTQSILSAARDPESVLGYIEVHIEQGIRLESAGLQVGVVTSIVGIRGMWLHFTGEAAHAGAMPIADRKDAMLGASTFTLQSRERIRNDFFPGVVNVGQIDLKPGAFNIVPAQVSIGVEYRHGELDQLDAMQAALIQIAEDAARHHDLQLEIEHLSAVEPAPMDETMMTHLEQTATALGLGHKRMMSFAGHDPQNMARIAPCAMYFVPSKDGISHNPAEFTSDEDCVNAANVMLNTVLALAKQQP